jgi:hypothetical protein
MRKLTFLMLRCRRTNWRHDRQKRSHFPRNQAEGRNTSKWLNVPRDTTVAAAFLTSTPTVSIAAHLFCLVLPTPCN